MDLNVIKSGQIVRRNEGRAEGSGEGGGQPRDVTWKKRDEQPVHSGRPRRDDRRLVRAGRPREARGIGALCPRAGSSPRHRRRRRASERESPRRSCPRPRGARTHLFAYDIRAPVTSGGLYVHMSIRITYVQIRVFENAIIKLPSRPNATNEAIEQVRPSAQNITLKKKPIQKLIQIAENFYIIPKDLMQVAYW